jgi:raffinose/stachyose/melibiose transport system substrate-binding protein
VKTRKIFPIVLILLVLGLIAGCAPAATQAPAGGETAADGAPAPVALTYLVDESEVSQATAKALADAYTAQNPHVTITIESRPGGADGDNIVKTRLATGEMTDIFFYNSGSLLQALNPSETLVDLSGEPFIANIAESFLPTVSQGEQIFGVPTGTAMGGGILYNRKIYEELGLSVPTTWAEFAANNEAIKAAGIPPVIATFGDTWTSQLFVLADYYNVAQAVPTFTEDYTNNIAKYATTPAALEGFKHMQEGFDKGWWQQDFATTTFEQGMKLLADGEGAHYPMLSFALSTIATNWPEAANDMGFFAQPGADAATNGATIWMPAGTYIPKTSFQHRRGQEVPGLHCLARGRRSAQRGCPAQRPLRDQGRHAARRSAAGRQGDRRLHRFRQGWPGAGVRLADQRPVAGADHRRRGHRPDDRRGRRRRLRR